MQKIELKQLSFDDVVARLKQPAHASRVNYGAMFSSWLGGIVTDPELMLVPIDDHGFHRGDAVFEAVKCIGRRIYALDRHLERMERSASAIGLKLPFDHQEMKQIAVATAQASRLDDSLFRIYASRGPGGFTTNPYECIAPQFYLVMTPFKPYPNEKYQTGVTALSSAVAIKESFFSTVKSCNYLPNVLMKKEAVDRGVDFTVSKDQQGFLAESSTENFAVISKNGEFHLPGFENTLKGVTAVRMMELARPLISSGLITGVGHARIKTEDVWSAREAMMLGTTLDVLPVTSFDGRAVGTGQVGPVCRELLRIMKEDLITGPLLTTL